MKAIKYISFNDKSGYGMAAGRYIKGLLEKGIPVTWTPLSPGKSSEPGLWYGPRREASRTLAELDRACMLDLDYDTVLVHTVPEYFPYWRKRERGRFLVGYTTWETDRLPAHWPPLLNDVDLLLVPCHWNKEVMRRCGVTVPIAVVPHIAEAIAGGDERLELAASPDDTIFYTINVWNARKAIWRTIEAYLQAFTAADNTLLVIKTGRQDMTRRGIMGFRPSTRRAIARLEKRYKHPARIQLVDEELTDGQIQSLHVQGHCFVSLTHGEGWGMGSFDAARAGNRVVMTGYGGQLAYLPPDLADLVNYELTPVDDPTGNSSYQSWQQWAEADPKDAVTRLRAVHALRGKPLPALARHVETHFNSRRVTDILCREIERHA